jgi:ABC-2 type transport system permease protein
MASKVGRLFQVSRAFIRMGYLLEISYPVAFLVGQLQALVPIFTYYFVDDLVGSKPNVGGDYFTFVVVGVLSVRVLQAGLGDLSTQVDEAIQQGRFETLLVEPIRWGLLPFGLVQWPLFIRLVTVVIIALIAILMGAHFVASAIPLAVLITLIGTAASLSIGMLAMSVKVLSKRSDPILNLYSLAAQILAGTYFPLHLLPLPLRVISWVIPQTYVVQANRKLLMTHGADIAGPSLFTSLTILTIFSVVGLTLAMWVLGRTMDYARRVGVLGGY